MSEAKTIPAKYIYLDVVGFTYKRSVEAQADIVHILNEIVEKSLDEIAEENLILLPTGDGMCIALLNIEHPYDIHMDVALKIILGVYQHNEKTESEMRKFQLRIGINSNVDNLVTDINANRNIAGAGISMAARVMSMGDGNQILVGEPVYDTLRHREKYMAKFKGYSAIVKHGVQLNVYQFVDEGNLSLNTSTPKMFVKPEVKEPKFTKFAAHFFAHAIKNREFFIKKKDELDHVSTILLFFLAKDTERNLEAKDIDFIYNETYGADKSLDIEKQFEYYSSIDDEILDNFDLLIGKFYLDNYSQYFEKGYRSYQFITQEGVSKLQREWPNVYKMIVVEE